MTAATTTRRTILHEIHVAAGATFTDFASWRMPVRYGSILAEHHAVRQAAGLFDLSHMAEIEVSGPQAPQALDYSLTGTASAIDVGRARYSMLCDENGGVIDDVVVYRLEPTSFWIVANAGSAAAVVDALHERVQAFDASVADVSETWALLAVQGPASPEVLDRIGVDPKADLLRYYAIAEARIGEMHVHVARTGYTGEDGFEIYCRSTDASKLWSLTREAGAPLGLLTAGLGARDTLRLEAGMPLYGHELSTSVTPFHVGQGRVVHLGKPSDFVGRHALERIASAQLDRVLVGLIGPGPRSPRSGQHIRLSATGEVLGVVTSGAPSPTLGHPIAMGFVPPEFAAPDTELVVDVRGAQVPVRVVTLPFYTRP